MTIFRIERTGSKTAPRLAVSCSEHVILILAVESGQGLGGYRLTCPESGQRRALEFDAAQFAEAGGRVAVPLRFHRTGEHCLSADVVCIGARAGSMIKLTVGPSEVYRCYASAKGAGKGLGASAAFVLDVV